MDLNAINARTDALHAAINTPREGDIRALADLEVQLPWTVIEDANGSIWQKRERRYGSSWYQPGDGQPHGAYDIALPAVVLRGGRPWSDDC